MPHDEHFLERLDRVSDSYEELELALGLYRDHELVRFVLDHVRLPEGADRVALALTADPAGPHVIVARDGGFVTCLGPGMKVGPHPVISRAHLDALAAKHQRIRTGLALARKRGMDSRALLRKMSSVGPAFPREDFLAAEAAVGPAAGVLLFRWVTWADALGNLLPPLLRARTGDSARGLGCTGVARGAWSLAHTMMVLVDTASREWVAEWSSMDIWSEHSQLTTFWNLSALPLTLRAAWLAARFGKPMLASYKTRFANPPDSMELREAGWGLIAMGLRHRSLRAEIWRTLLARKAQPTEPHWVGPGTELFTRAAQILDEREDVLRANALARARQAAVVGTAHLPESSPLRFASVEQVSDEAAMPWAFATWHDARAGDNAGTLMLEGAVLAAKARAEDFYFPAQLLHALGPPDLEPIGASIVEFVRARVGSPQPVARQKGPGRNDPCKCGSGKKYKKC
ncbi:MAG TPA: SEC-C metal-binding domain-containing protein, partial [Polyangiaceae bacterium]|nr:SEC-C metal-binding domain-containing protein [Polyangiaceae bacterium]